MRRSKQSLRVPDKRPGIWDLGAAEAYWRQALTMLIRTVDIGSDILSLVSMLQDCFRGFQVMKTLQSATCHNIFTSPPKRRTRSSADVEDTTSRILHIKPLYNTSNVQDVSTWPLGSFFACLAHAVETGHRLKT